MHHHHQWPVPQVPYHAAIPTCAGCNYQGQMQAREKISSGGWVLFAVMFLLLCWPLCWIPLVSMKERAQVCPRCGTQWGVFS